MNSITLLKSSISHLGGLEKYTLRLCSAFQKRGCEVRLLTTGDTKLIDSLSSIDVSSMDFSSKLSFLKIREFDSFCQKKLEHKPSQIVFGLDRNYNQTHIRAGNGVHLSYLERRKKSEGFLKALSFSINPLHKKLLDIEKRSFESPELKTLFTNSNMVKNEILSYYNVDPKKICVVHNGVEWSEMQKPFDETFTKRESIFKELKLDCSKYQILFLGHNFKRKGLTELLKGLSLVKGFPFHLSVVGTDKDIDSYKKLTNALGISSNVTFWGQRKDVLSFYQIADCLVIPSHYDPFANVTVEALNMGLFVISSKNNGGSEVLSNSSGEIIDNLFDPESVKSSLAKAFSQPKTLNSAQAIRKSVEHLDFPNQLNLMVDKTLF